MADGVRLVTGASSGIGLEVAKLLAEQGHRVILTARTKEKAAKSVAAVLEYAPNAIVRSAILEITKDADTTAVIAAIKDLGGELEGVVNNAGLAGDLGCQTVTDRALGSRIMDVNYYGLKSVISSLEPYLSPTGFIVNVSSLAAYDSMGNVSEHIFNRLKNASEDDLDVLAEEFLLRYVEAENIQALDAVTGHHLYAYLFSKALVNRLTELLAKRFPKRTINAVSPGFCDTPMTIDMYSSAGKRTSREGARGVIQAIESTSGWYYEDEDGEFTRSKLVERTTKSITG